MFSVLVCFVLFCFVLFCFFSFQSARIDSYTRARIIKIACIWFVCLFVCSGGGRRLAFDNTSKLFITVMNVIKNDVLASEIEEREYGLMTLETLMLNCKNSQIITLFPQLIGFLKQQISYDPNFVSIALQEVRGTNNVASPPKSQASNVDTNMSGDNNNDTATTQAKDDNGGNDGADEDAGGMKEISDNFNPFTTIKIFNIFIGDSFCFCCFLFKRRLGR